jgi:hypothetical protein
MTAVVKEVYDAFKKAGVPEEDAWAPAAAPSTHERHFAEVKTEITGLDRRLDGFAHRLDGFDHRLEAMECRFSRLEADVGELKGDIADVKAELRMHRWVLASSSPSTPESWGACSRCDGRQA